MKHHLQRLAAILFLVLTSSPVAHATGLIPEPGNVNSTGNNRPTQIQPGRDSLDQIVNNILGVLIRYLAIIGIVIFLALIWQGIRYMLAQDNPSNAAAARNAVIQLILAAAILSVAGFLVAVLWAVASSIGGAAATGTVNSLR